MVEGYGPLSTLHEAEERLATGIPLTSFEFQRIFRVINSQMGMIRMRVTRGAAVTPEELTKLDYLTHLQQLALHLRPMARGTLGGYSSAEQQVRAYERSQRAREVRHGS